MQTALEIIGPQLFLFGPGILAWIAIQRNWSLLGFLSLIALAADLVIAAIVTLISYPEESVFFVLLTSVYVTSAPLSAFLAFGFFAAWDKKEKRIGNIRFMD